MPRLTVAERLKDRPPSPLPPLHWTNRTKLYSYGGMAPLSKLPSRAPEGLPAIVSLLPYCREKILHLRGEVRKGREREESLIDYLMIRQSALSGESALHCSFQGETSTVIMETEATVDSTTLQFPERTKHSKRIAHEKDNEIIETEALTKARWEHSVLPSN
uniref:Uncharacterized protein n=1 Tax=Oryza rufipogon TaxID=4529 RepID=A0A0E0NS01_ORYRU